MNHGRAPRRRSGCGTALGCLAATAAAVFAIVRAVTMWVTGHPWAVITVAVLVAAGGTLGGWLAARTEHRRKD